MAMRKRQMVMAAHVYFKGHTESVRFYGETYIEGDEDAYEHMAKMRLDICELYRHPERPGAIIFGSNVINIQETWAIQIEEEFMNII